MSTVLEPIARAAVSNGYNSTLAEVFSDMSSGLYTPLSGDATLIWRKSAPTADDDFRIDPICNASPRKISVAHLMMDSDHAVAVSNMFGQKSESCTVCGLEVTNDSELHGISV